MDTFTYVPDYSAQVSVEPRVSKISYGDGYESRWTDGLNTNLEKWSLQFKCDPTRAKEIYQWLKAKGGVYAFAWTTTDGDTLAFVCPNVSKTHDSIGWQTVSATFTQVTEAIL